MTSESVRMMTVKGGRGLTSANVSRCIPQLINVRRDGSTKAPETDMDHHTDSAFILTSEIIAEPTQNVQDLQFE